MIRTRSRFNAAVMVQVEGGDGVFRPTIYNRTLTRYNPTYSYYTVPAGKRLDQMAHDFYGNAALWWKIADANPEYFNPTDIVGGSLIRVPHL